MRTKEEIDKKIEELIADQDNFCSDNYGSEGCDNGFYEIHFSEWSTENTLQEFAKWLLNEK